MRIEKNTKTPTTENETFGAEKNRPLLEQEKTLIFLIKQWVLNNRLNSRQKLLANPVNLASVVAFLPLVLGFSQFLSNASRSSQHLDKRDHFFEKNLPVFTDFKPKLSFETFEYISKSNKRGQTISPSTTLMFGPSPYGVTLKKPASLCNKNFNGITCDFYLLTSQSFPLKTSSILTLARNLDELPAYVQGFKQVQYENKSLLTNFKNDHEKIWEDSLFSNVKKQNNRPKFQEFGKEIEKDLGAKNSVFGTKKEKLSFSSTLRLMTSDKKLTLVPRIKENLNKTWYSDVHFQENQFYKDRLDFYNDKTQVKNEIQNAFTEKQVSCNDFLVNFSEQNKNQDEISLLKLISTKNSQITNEFATELLLQGLDKIRISEDLPSFRSMSGYNYPDMTSEELYWFYSSNLRKSTGGPKIVFFDRLPATSKDYNFNVKKFPEIAIETHQVSVRDPESNSLFSTGPALVLDSKRALDWKTTSKQNLRSWFNTYVSPLNPLVQSIENFFGVYKSPKLGQDHQNTDFNKQSVFSVKATSSGYFAGAGFFDAVDESVANFSPSSISFQLISNQEIGKPSSLKNVEVSLSKNQDTDHFLTLPVLQLQHPVTSSVDPERETLQNYSPYFTFTNKGNPDYEFSTDSFSTKNFVTKYTSGSYTKTASVYSKTKFSTQLNVDHWEPLTSTWWLIVTQFSFAFFIFHVLKSLADNYGRELLGYLLDLIASLGILDDSLKQEIEILLGQRDKGFRVILESQKNFKDIVGIEKLLPEIYEVVWFLRNSARDFSLSKTLPRGILLTGPPGTGKTLLVQALAGEARVPVVVLSGSSLIEPGESGALKLEKVFQEARDIAPCIVFIDEIDTLAQKRNGVVQNPMGSDELLESVTSLEKHTSESALERLQLAREKQEAQKEGENFIQQNSQEQQLSLLTQFLIELDGIQGRDGVVVIGATNRPEVLDPALLRPGRLEKIIQVGLPGHKKRVEILQFYGQGLGYQTSIPWNYLGDRTAGFTAADLATLMNESTIKAILSKTKHTIETIEHGIDRLTTSENEKHTVLKTKTNESEVPCLTVASKMAILRLAYYQAGKIVLSYVLETHPKSVVASLWPRRPTIRSAQIATNLQNSIFEFARLCEITDRLIGCYAGKAAEVLFVQQFSSSKYAQLSTLGFEDLLFAQKLVYCLLEKWSFFSKKRHIQQKTHLPPNINTREFREILEKLDLYNGIVQKIQIPPMSQALEMQTSSLESKKKSGVTNWNAQKYYSIPWWQQEISSELEFVEKNFTNWSRLYLSNPEQSERNPEWLPPDEFYHTSSGLKNVKKAFSNLKTIKNKPTKQPNNLVAPVPKTEFLRELPGPGSKFGTESGGVKQKFLPQKAEFSWNEVALLTRDYPGQSLVLQSFNKALNILNQNRELLDRLVVELLYKEILRQPDVEQLIKEFALPQQNLFNNVNPTEITANQSNLSKVIIQNKENLEILESSWGPNSRKPLPRWIDFAEFSEKTT